MRVPADVAAMEAVAQVIREAARSDVVNKNCGVQPGGNPPPVAGDLYISIDEGGASNPDAVGQDHLTEELRITVWISVRLGVLPVDRRSSAYFGAINAISPIDRQIIAGLHGNWNLRTIANAKLGANDIDTQEFQDTLWYRGREKTRIEDGSWSHQTDKIGWLVRPLNFSGFRRVQRNDSIT